MRPNTRTVTAFACIFSVALGAGCRGSAEPSPADQLSQSAASAFVDFTFSNGDAVDSARQDAFHVWAITQLKVIMTSRLRYSKYRDRGHIQRVTGQATNGYALPEQCQVHSIWPWDAHEAVHVYTALIGRPSDFFNEGIAVALAVDPTSGDFAARWNGTPLHDLARNAKRAGTLPLVNAMMTTDAFRAQSDQVSYPAAGSFVAFLLERKGIDAVRVFFASSARADGAATIESRFSQAFSWTVAEADAAWRAYLG